MVYIPYATRKFNVSLYIFTSNLLSEMTPTNYSGFPFVIVNLYNYYISLG